MITIEIYSFLICISIALIGLSYILNKEKSDGLILRLSGSIMLLILGFTMLVSDIVYRVGAVVTNIDQVSTITYTTALFDNYYIAFTIILISIALIIQTSISVYDKRYEDETTLENF